MDTERRSNGERPGSEKTIAEEIAFFEEEFFERPRKKVKANSMLLLIAGIFITLFCVISAVRISSYSQGPASQRGLTKLQQAIYGNENAAWGLREELLRYEKNLQRFFIHYDGFDPDSFREVTAATPEEIERLKMEHEVIYQQAVREIMDNYNDRIRIAEESFSTEVSVPSDSIGGTTASMEFYSINPDITYTLPDGSRFKAVTVIPEEYEEYARLINERDALIAEARGKYLISDEQATKIVEQNKQESSVYNVSNYYEIKAYLENAGFFQYCLKSTKTGEYITNVPAKSLGAYKNNPMEFVEQTNVYYISVQDGFFDVLFNDVSLNESFKSAGLSGYILIPPNYGTNNPVATFFTETQFNRNFYAVLTLSVIIACVIAAIVWGLFIKSDKSAVRKVYDEVKRRYYKLPIIVKCGLLGCSVAVFVLNSQVFYNFSQAAYNRGLISAIFPFAAYLAAATAAVLYILIVLGHLWEFIKKPSIILNEPEICFTMRFFKNIKLVYSQQVLGVTLAMTFLVVSYILVQLALFAVVLNSGGVPVEAFIVCEIIINILALYVFGLVVALAKTNRYMDAIIAGDLDIEINERGLYRGVINKLNRLRGGVRRVVGEKNKSEKMKADLITNVSHDLKTPLTSIINYIELLKSPQISDSDKAEYIDVLDRKAQRVKHLIDDLFEATKLSSGQITLKKEHLNAVDLLKQAVGELEDKFISADISLKLTYSVENVPVIADGKKLWRVFENLFSNMIKYAQPSTRAYVDVGVRGRFAEIVFKNISYYEMNFDYTELFERFRRGDAARGSEGSGLGLSIAKDIVELHEGAMDILIDGDLFKVIVRLPVA